MPYIFICLASQCFSPYPTKGTIYEKKAIESKCVFYFLYNIYLKHFPLQHEFSKVSQRYVRLHVKYPLFMSDFNETLVLSTDFRKILKYQISWKFLQWEPGCAMPMDSQTDMTNLIVAFRKFTKAPNNDKGAVL